MQEYQNTKQDQKAFCPPVFFINMLLLQFSQNSSLECARASAAQPTIKLATIKQAVSVVILVVSATQLD